MSTEEKLILWLDDEIYLMLPLIEILDNCGYRVECVTDVNAALEWLQQGELPDLMLCDLMLFDGIDQSIADARRSGFQVLGALPRLGVDCPVIVVTGMNSAEILSEARNLVGDNCVLLKPVDHQELVRKVRAILEDPKAE